MNNRLQNNIGEIKTNYQASALDTRAERFEGATGKFGGHGYGFKSSNFEDDFADLYGGPDLAERQKAWAELELESEEVKRKIKGHMRM